MKPSFWGKIDQQGNGRMYPEHKKKMLEWFRNNPGKEFYVVAYLPEMQRDLNQNAHMHAIFGFIAKEKNMDLEDVKRMATAALVPFDKHQVVERLLETFEPNDHFETAEEYEKYLYDHLPAVGRPTSDLSYEEARDFIQQLYPWALHEFNVVVPTKGDVHYE